ncbi:MAG: hypothetical protein LBG72_01645 [Spirochaetaceae bacterium]|nr:hypothetical protein [Spirochaetaceae bacterium]
MNYTECRSSFIFSIICICFLYISAGNIYAQSTTTEIKPPEFPQWAKDLRRAEIVMFGSFPFAWFTTMLFTDLARSASHNWQDLYWPWPAKPAGAVEMSAGEYGTTLSIAAGISILIAITDHLILRNKRYYNKMRQSQRPPVEPIIERTPLYPGGDAPSGTAPAPAPPTGR